ncbi:MAG: hypothetical protein RIQ90_1618 [Bacteroidota bacterium]
MHIINGSRSRKILFFCGMLIMLIGPKEICAQSVRKDTLSTFDERMTDIVKYGARDSSFYSVNEKRAYLYGGAYVETKTTRLTAGMIVIDLEKNEIEASFLLGKDSLPTELPTLVDEGETLSCHRMRLNTKTNKAFIEDLSLKQDEFYFHMGVAKRFDNDEIHLTSGRLTTCDQEEPHYHFLLSKGVIIPEKRVVAGPMNLWISGLPTPIGLPFAIIPQQKERTKGLIFPEFIPASAYGFGIQNLGYYIPINPRLQTTVFANLYSRGSWGIRNEMDYAKRYGYTGRFSMGFQQFNNGFPNYTKNNKLTLAWSHSKAQKSNPFWNFNANVNFISDNTAKNNPDPINPDYFRNSFNSDINLNRNFLGKPITMGAKLSLRQNSIAKSIALVSPVFNVNVTRIFPFGKIITHPKSEFGKSLQRLGVSYNMEGQNKATFGDSLFNPLNTALIGQSFMNGISQNAAIQTTLGVFKNAIKVTPSITLGNKINFQQISKSYDPLLNKTVTDTLSKIGLGNEININVNATTVLYSYYRFVGKKKPILRHLMTPSVGYRYVPKLNALISANVGPNQSLINYSPFERSIYQVGNLTGASFLTFGVNNTLELKVKSDKDTVTGYRKIRVLDQFSINGNYDFMRDSMNLSDLSMNLRVSPAKWLNIVSTGLFSLYAWDSLGKTTSDYALSMGQGIGRFLSASLNSTFSITSAKGRKVLEENATATQAAWNSDFAFYSLHPEQAVYFDIPWKLNVSHVLSVNANTQKSSASASDWNWVQTIALQGDVSFTKRWNLGGNINVDVQTQRITNMNLSLNRNLHCWALSFYWTPIGGNKAFLLSIRNTSSIFRDAKLDIRKPPSFF